MPDILTRQPRTGLPGVLFIKQDGAMSDSHRDSDPGFTPDPATATETDLSPWGDGRRQPPSRPISFTWPLIIALSACSGGGGGGGGGGSRPLPTVTLTAEVKGDPFALSLYAPEISVWYISEDGTSWEFVKGQDVSFEIPDGTRVVRDGIPIDIDIAALPRGLKVVSRDGKQFIEGTVTQTAGTGKLVLILTSPGHETVRIEQPWSVAEALPPTPEEDSRPAPVPETPVQPVPEPEPAAPNSAPVIYRTIPTITLYTEGDPSNVGKERLLINLKRHFQDPERDPLRFSSDDVPDGLTLQQNGPWLYGRPTKPGTYKITITAKDFPLSGESISISYRFTIHAVEIEARNVLRQDHRYDILIGDPLRKDIFDTTTNPRVEHIHNFVQGKDKIHVGVSEIYIKWHQPLNGWQIFDKAQYDREAGTGRLADVIRNNRDQNQDNWKLTDADFQAHLLNDVLPAGVDDFADMNVVVTEIQ